MTISKLVAMTLVAGTGWLPGGTMANTHQNDMSLVGKSVDLTPWAYLYRADVKVQKQPEAYFIPRRLERLEKVYRTAPLEMSKEDLRSFAYNQPDMLKPFPPKPKGQLQTGLLWTGSLNDYQVELHWPAGASIPSQDKVDVRAYPTSFGWFGWTVDKVMTNPTISEDGRTWTFKSDPTEIMDSSYNNRVPAATEMVAVFIEGEKPTIPTLRVVGPNLGVWQRMDIEIEWGFDAKTNGKDFDCRLEPFVAQVGAITPLKDDSGTVVNGEKWTSAPTAKGRRGIVVPLLYAPDSRPGLDSRVTVWSKKGGFTIRLSDLDRGPIYIPEQGIFVKKSAGGPTAQQFIKDLASKNLKSIRQMTREHPEASSFEQLMKEVRLWTCPEGTTLKPFVKVPDPAMSVELSDPQWTDAWRSATNQLRGKHMWGVLAFEVGRVAYDMEIIGLHDEANKVYDYFLKSPGIKSDGDFSDGTGSLEWASDMRHDMGYSHNGTHASTGRVLFAMAERYFLTGDKEWFGRNQKRLQAAADWIIRQRNSYMKDIPNRKDLFVAGLMPPQQLGDYAMPACDWHWYYVDNILALQGLQRFADALIDFDPKAAQAYLKEAKAFRKDIQRIAGKDGALAPVRLGRDGAYHSFIPRMTYARGLTGPELGAPQFPDSDKFMGALPLAEPYGAIDPEDPLMMDTLNALEEMGTSSEAIQKGIEERAAKGQPTQDAWFYNCFVILPKASHNGSIFLRQDDIPSFLRFWSNAYASVVGADGKLWEHWHLGNYDPCGAPDNGTAGWFMEGFRDLLVNEDGDDLWIAKGTPRAWLEQGKRIAVRNAPTHFGDLAYEIVSDVDQGHITATIEVPSRRSMKSVVLRLRHPSLAKIKGVTVNGKPWSKFNAKKETITLSGLNGKVTVVASY
jgi:hypothetical protein